MPKKRKKKESCDTKKKKCGKGKAWRRGENKRLERSALHKYVQIYEDGKFFLHLFFFLFLFVSRFFFSREIFNQLSLQFSHHVIFVLQYHLTIGQQSKETYNGKKITETRSHVDVALAVAKKMWSRTKTDIIIVKHLDSGRHFRFDPRSWMQSNGERKFDSGKSKRRDRYNRTNMYEEESSFSTIGSSSYSTGYGGQTNLRIRTPPSRYRKRTNSGIDDSPRSLKSPRLSSPGSGSSTGLTPRLSATSINPDDVSPMERRKKLRQPVIE